MQYLKIPESSAAKAVSRRSAESVRQQQSSVVGALSFVSVRAPAVFHRVKYRRGPRVKRRRVTGFTNGKEAAVGLTKVVPFLVEDELKRIGGIYEKEADWAPFAVFDDVVVTGQNPASLAAAARALLEVLVARKAARTIDRSSGCDQGVCDTFVQLFGCAISVVIGARSCHEY